MSCMKWSVVSRQFWENPLGTRGERGPGVTLEVAPEIVLVLSQEHKTRAAIGIDGDDLVVRTFDEFSGAAKETRVPLPK